MDRIMGIGTVINTVTQELVTKVTCETLFGLETKRDQMIANWW